MNAEKITKVTTGNYDWQGMMMVNNGDNGELVRHCNRLLRKEFPELWFNGYRIVFSWGMYSSAQIYKPYEYAGGRWQKWPEYQNRK